MPRRRSGERRRRHRQGRALADEGWQVFITGPDGIHYHPSEFDKLLSFSAGLRPPRHAGARHRRLKPEGRFVGSAGEVSQNRTRGHIKIIYFHCGNAYLAAQNGGRSGAVSY